MSWEQTCLWDAKWRDCWWSSWFDSVSSWWACSPWSLWLWRNRLMIHNSARAWTATTATTPNPNPSKIEPQNEGILIFEAKKLGYYLLVRWITLWCRMQVRKGKRSLHGIKEKANVMSKEEASALIQSQFFYPFFFFLFFSFLTQLVRSPSNSRIVFIYNNIVRK